MQRLVGNEYTEAEEVVILEHDDHGPQNEKGKSRIGQARRRGKSEEQLIHSVPC
jgi:hypothetical protein